MTGRHILGRALLAKSATGYEGRLVLFGFAYSISITRTADGVELVAYEGEKPEISRAYQISLLDG